MKGGPKDILNFNETNYMNMRSPNMSRMTVSDMENMNKICFSLQEKMDMERSNYFATYDKLMKEKHEVLEKSLLTKNECELLNKKLSEEIEKH